MSHGFNVDVIPALNPRVEERLLECLKVEVAAYSCTVQGKRCLLCPFRTFSRLAYLKAHLKHHSAKNWYMADRRSPQWSVLRACFDYYQAVTPVAAVAPGKLHLLRQSAALILKWNRLCSPQTMDLLQSQNRPVLVRVLTHKGPEYWAKSLTGTCMRPSKKIYCTVKFADLFLSMLLTNQCRISTSLDALYLHFGGTSKTPSLLPEMYTFWNDLLELLTSHPAFKTKVSCLKSKAAAAGELEVVTHDETFKVLFSLLGQKAMSQTSGELHALHTFRGFTGCTIGVSAQRSTSAKCFTAAVNATFDQHLAAQVKFIFSDAPTRIIKAARSSFPNLLAVGEDPIHLPIRLEYCWGERTTDASARVRQLHRKFQVPTSTVVPFWQPEDHIANPRRWPDVQTVDTRDMAEWSAFCKEPFTGKTAYSSYVEELAKISVMPDAHMECKSKKGVTALKILKNGGSREHFEALQNSSRLLSRLGAAGRRLGAGTTRNEQLHKELKSWGRNIYQAHIPRLQNGLRIFELTKLLTHASAAYSPTLCQSSQQRLLNVIASDIRETGFFPPLLNHLMPPAATSNLKRSDLQTALVQPSATSVLRRKQIRLENKRNWKKKGKQLKRGTPNSTNVFKRRRKKIGEQ